MEREENGLLTPLSTAQPALVPGLPAHGLNKFNPFGLSLSERTNISSDLNGMNGNSVYSPASSPSPSGNPIRSNWPKNTHRQSPTPPSSRDFYQGGGHLSWSSPPPSAGPSAQFQVQIPESANNLDLIVSSLEKFGIKLTEDQQKIKEQITTNRRAINEKMTPDVQNQSPMSPTFSDSHSSFLMPPKPGVSANVDDKAAVFPSAHDFDGIAATFPPPIGGKRGKTSWDSGTSSSLGSPTSSRPVKPIGNHRSSGSGFPSPGSVGQDRPKQKLDPWQADIPFELGSFDDLSSTSFISDNLRRRVENLLASNDPDELDFTEDIKKTKKEVAERRWNIEHYPCNYGIKEVPASISPPLPSTVGFQQKTLKDVIASSSSSTSPDKAPPSVCREDTKDRITPSSDLSRRDSSDRLQGHEYIQPEETGILSEKLQQGFKFARICSTCFIQRKVGFDGFDHIPPPGHQCAKNVLVVRAIDSTVWKRVRNMPHHIDYRGPFLLCRHISQSEACPYADACTFCYNEEEKEIWSWERRGLFNRTRLFTDPVVDPIAHFLRQYQGQFFSCKGAHLEDPSNCNCVDETLYYQQSPGTRPSIIRDTPDGKTMELCRYSSTNRCNRGDHCYFAHSMVELDAWRIFVSAGVSPDEILATANSLASPTPESPAPFSSSFAFKHKWICSQCNKNGQTVERRGKTAYCSSRQSHSWRDPLLYVHLDKWSLVRDLTAVFNKSNTNLPSTFVVCKNIRDKNRCDYGEVCQFSHSDEECRVWNYMKENNIKGLKELYKRVSKV